MTHDVRTALAEVWRRTVEWRERPDWTATEQNQRRYEITRDAVHTVAAGDPSFGDDPGAIVVAVELILREWQPSRSGSEQQIYAAVDRLRDTVRRHDGR